MDRRRIIAALACSPVLRLHAQQEGPRPRHKISAGTLHEALSERFPLQFGLPGLLDLQLSAPRLLLRPARNQLGAGLLLEVGAPRMQQLPAGELDLVFTLRYEASDQTVRAHHPEVLDLRWPGLPPETKQAIQGLLPAMATHLGEIILHRFAPGDLALADTMGFEPDEIQVVDDGLVVLFAPRPPR